MVAVTELWVHKFCKFGSFSDSMNIMQMELLNEICCKTLVCEATLTYAVGKLEATLSTLELVH